MPVTVKYDESEKILSLICGSDEIKSAVVIRASYDENDRPSGIRLERVKFDKNASDDKNMCVIEEIDISPNEKIFVWSDNNGAMRPLADVFEVK